jgi:hypothetical protein
MTNLLRRLPWAPVVLVMLATGCGQSGPEVVRVTGTVIRHGTPVNSVVIHFVPENGRPSWGLTDQEGHYTLNYERGRDGAITGKHKVWIEFRPTSPKQEADFHNGKLKLHPDLTAILQTYGKQSSPLVKEVTENNQVIDLSLD